jgi:hypothetical protein
MRDRRDYSSRMLKNFLYLNQDSLAAYLSGLEGGLRSATEQSSSTSVGIGGGVDAKILSGKANRTRQDATTLSLDDTAYARFERLEELATNDAERAGWINVLVPDSDLDGVGIGALIDIECEVYVPDLVKALSPAGGLTEALDMLDTLRPMAGVLGLDMPGLPEASQLSAMRSLTNLGSDQILVGERDDTPWRIAGKLLGSHLRGEIEGVARVVGKVAATWAPGQWKPLLSLPGMNLIPRDQRRKLEREAPSPDQAGNYLEGPAIMLDLLAVYR